MRPFNVWLVHGTWARHAAWVEETSRLSTKLRQRFGEDITLERVVWTGRNRMQDRDQAASQLVAAVTTKRDGNHQNFVIAHSHGGNIASLAALKDGAFCDGVVTLNTPFLFPVIRNRHVMAIHGILLMIALWIFPSYLPGLSIVDSMLVRLGLGGVLFLILWSHRNDEWPDIGADRRRTEACPFLCLTSSDDEAFGWLQAVDVLVNLPYLLLHRWILVFALGLMGVLHYVQGWAFGRGTMYLWAYAFIASRKGSHGVSGGMWDVINTRGYLSPTWVQTFDSALRTGADSLGLSAMVVTMMFSTLEYFVVSWAVLATAALLLSVVVRAISLGRSISFWAFIEGVIIRAHIVFTPMWFTNVELRLVDSLANKWLIHSELYDDDDAIDALADWIDQQRRRHATIIAGR